MNKRYLALCINKVVFPSSVGVVSFTDEFIIKQLKAASFANQRIIFVSKSIEETEVFVGDVGVMIEIEQLLNTPFDIEAKLAYKAENNIVVESVEPSEGEGIFFVTTSPLKYEDGDSDTIKSLYNKASAVYLQYMKLLDQTPAPFRLDTINEDINHIISRIHSSNRFLFVNSKSTEQRLIYFIKTIYEAINIQEIDEEVSQKVKEAIDLNQREYYVREQIRALSSEIDDEDETEEYLTKIDELKASEDIKSKLKKEAKRINKTAPASPEMAILKNYLDCVLELPWGIFTKDNDDLKNAEEILNDEHYGLEKIKERLIEALAVRKLSKDGKSPIICLVGPPGTGKTSIARSIAHAMNKNYVRLSFGGVRDEAEIRGHRKTYVGAMPGRIITSIKTAGSMNPVFLMDEIDKMASDYKGDPASALLEVLDPEQNVNFRDHFIEMPFDLSKVLFITTANSLDNISRPLLDRMEIIELSGYTEPEKMEIAKRYLIPKSIKNSGIVEDWVDFTDAAIGDIINNYTKESGVRGLEKQINKVIRKIVKINIDNKDAQKVVLTTANLSTYLGEAPYKDTQLSSVDEVGVVTGLAWTQVGGETLSIEVLITKGKGDIQLTGSLGDVMKESARIAISYLKGLSDEFGLPDNYFKEHDINIHVPEGATPKDGPSAGVTITTALASALCNKKVDHTVAMTGEVTLLGKVLPIGGLKEKTLAAVRMGIKKVYIPEENKKDYNELPQLVKDKLQFEFVNNVKTIISGVLI